MHDDREHGETGETGETSESGGTGEQGEEVMGGAWHSIHVCDVPGEAREAAMRFESSVTNGGIHVVRLATGWQEQALHFALERCARHIQATAWQLARHDRDLRDDLEQEGRIAVWRMHPLRLAAAINPEGYLRAAIRHAMLRYLRTMSRQDPAERRIDWRIVEEVLETLGERRGLSKRAA